MTAAGLAAFAARRSDRTAVYSHEQGGDAVLQFTEHERARLQSVAGAWDYLDAQPGSYRRAVIHWLHTAVRPETRDRRLDLLATESSQGRHVAQFRRR